MGNYAGLVVNGADRFDQFGTSISGVGDFNGDGFEDFIVGAPRATDLGLFRFNGGAYIIFGAADGPATLDVGQLDGSNGFKLTPEGARGDGLVSIGDGGYIGSYIYAFGEFVAGVGDVNGDGLADIAVAGRTSTYYTYGSDPLERPNAIFIVFGTRDPFGSEFAVGDLDGTNGFQVIGTGGFLNGIEAAGDFNDDGVADFLISQSPVPVVNYDGGYYGGYFEVASAPVALAVGPEEEALGAAGYVIFGATGIGAGGLFDIADNDGANGAEIAVARSFQTGRFFDGDGIGFYSDARSFTTALGDVNGDGFADIGVRSLVRTVDATRVYDESGDHTLYEVTEEARFHIVFGRELPDSYGDGRPERIDTTFYDDVNFTGEDGVAEMFWGPVSGVYFGSNSLYENANVRGIGDINGDGFDDVAVSQPNINVPNPAGTSVGYVDVFFGGSDGPRPFGEADLRIIKTDQTLDYLGAAITAIGDVNGDGVDDFAVSAPETFFGSVDGIPVVADGVFIIFGSRTGPTLIDLNEIGRPGGDGIGYRLFSSDSITFNGSGFGRAVSSAGDVNGDGVADIIIGAPYANVNTLPYGGTNAGRAFVVFGGLAALEAADNADGTDDNVIDVANIIVDVDTGVLPIALSVANAGLIGEARAEGDSGATIFTFEVRRTGDLTEAVSFDFAVTPVGAGINGADFIGGVLPSGTASFAAGSDTSIVEIEVQGDLVVEASEVFAFTISNPVAETSPISIAAGQTLARIDNDDFPISFFTQGGSVFEGNPGDERVLTFTVVRTGPGFAATVDFVIEGDSVSPVDEADFAPGEFPRSGTLEFGAGEFSKAINLIVSGDFEIESSERARLTLSNAQSDDAVAQIGGAVAIGTIRNDDFAPELFVRGDSFLLEGDPGDDVGFAITFERRGDFGGPVEITYTVTPSPAAGDFFAADADDLEGELPQGPFTVTIPDGAATASIRIAVAEDTVIEPFERFSVNIVAVNRPEGGVIYDVTRPSHVATILNDDGRPPVIPPGVEADVFGDPHIVTLDGLGYDFQAVGEYILVETLPGQANPFQVQVRFEPLPGSDLVSVTTRMAVKIGDVLVEIDAKGADTLLIGGAPATAEQLALGVIDVDGDGVADIFLDEATGTIFLVLNAADEQLAVKVVDGSLNICVFLSSEPDGNAGHVRGLMGDGAGDGTANDLTLREDGTVLDQPVDFAVLYGAFADSWRIDGSEGKERFFDDEVTFPEGFPAAVITLDDLPPDLRAMAEAAALAAGLDAENTAVFNGAVLDFALTGNANFIQGALGVLAETTATTEPANAPALPAVIGVTVADAGEEVFEGDEGEQLAVFTFYRIGDATGELTVTYAIGGDVDADDLGAGQALTGTATFAEGETSVSIAVAVAGDLDTEPDETLTVSITGVSDPSALVAGPSATKLILTDDFPPEAVDDFFSTTEDARLSGNLIAANPDEADSDANGDALTVVSVTSGDVTRAVNASAGTGLFILDSGAHLIVQADGSFTFDPFGFKLGDAASLTEFDRLDSGEIGIETFTYTVTDGNGGFATAVATISVTGVNDAPIALNDSIRLSEDDAEAGVNVITDDGVDMDPEGGPLAVTRISFGAESVDVDPLLGATLMLASGATLTIRATGAATFFTNEAFEDLGDQPGQTAQRTVSFTYTVTDAGGLSSTALLNVTVDGVNDAPVISPIEAAFLANEDGRNVNLLGDAFDAEGDDLTVEDVVVSGPDGQTIVFAFDPATGLLTLGDGQFGGLSAGETADVVVTYAVGDGAASTANTATITITGVDAPNRAPVAVDDSFATRLGSILTVDAANGLLANDSDPDGDAISVTLHQPAQFGDIVVSADGAFTYTPNAGVSGTETILYTISDGFDVATATLTITVREEDDRPLTLGTAGDDVLVAPEFGAILDGLGGRDVYVAGAGADTFVLGDGDKDQFRRFDATTDKLDVSAWGVQSFAELTIFDRTGADGARLLTILDQASRNVAFHHERSDRLLAEDLTADNFLFAPAADLIVTGVNAAGSERVFGRSGDDVIVNDGGFNRLFGQGGADTFVIGTFRGGVIGDFTVGEDVIDISAWGVGGLDDLRITETETLIFVRDRGSNLVRLDKVGGLEAADLATDSFLFDNPLIG